ncbi:hypothetical protein C241_02734 [Bradyrhizobium lupini HPC(L)]|uniref:Uncharacterized protein n=1 Tax=Bradyrhizobium lupini HPC(L) TaxID=1229491 RepID=A0ABN0HRC6_RHILU|nr:hypothetical protein C241_02734 [Bradyrhizobium lupini HPC(L)]
MTGAAREASAITFLRRMTSLYAELDTVWSRHGELPDEVSDAIVDAAGLLCDAIINAPIKCEDDIARKLRFAADLVSSKDGVMLAERPAVERALRDLITFREAELRVDKRLLDRLQLASAHH